MENLNRNRLIGGGVLILASLLFVPAILTPIKQPLTNPNFPVSTTVIPKVLVNKQSAKSAHETVKKTETIKLVSTEDSASENNQSTRTEPVAETKVKSTKTPVSHQQSSNQLVPVKLESLETKKAEKIKKAEKAIVKAVKPTKQESWIRVASFSNLANADELVTQLKRKKYPVKIENITIKNKPYRRVLLGPYASEKEMRSVLNQIQKEGFRPDVQR